MVHLHMQKLFKGRVEIPITKRTSELCRTILDKQTIRQRYCIAKSLYNEGKTYSEISSILKVAERTIKKYVETPDNQIPIDKKVGRGIEHENAVKKVQDKVELVKNLIDKGYSVYRISKETGFIENTINRYLSQDFNPVNGQYGNSRYGLLTPYKEEVIELLSQGNTYEKTAEIIRLKGYTGSVAAIRRFIARNAD